MGGGGNGVKGEISFVGTGVEDLTAGNGGKNNRKENRTDRRIDNLTAKNA